MALTVQLLSIVGAGMILIAFFGLQRGWLDQNGSTYLWLNLVGATGLTVVAVHDGRIGFIVLEAVWALVSLMSIVKPTRRAWDAPT